MTLSGYRAAAAVVAVNLALFIGVVSLPAFQSAHHHWIFPLLAALLAVQWAAARGPARASVASLLAFLLAMGIARHQTILTCFDRCAFKLALAAALAAPVFFAHARTADPGIWKPVRARLAALGCLLWAVYLGFKGLRLSPWMLDLGFAATALLLWLKRRDAVFLLGAVGIAGGLGIRATANEFAIIGLGLVWCVALAAVAPEVERRLGRRPPAAPEPMTPRRRIARALGLGLGTAGLGFYVIGPVFLMTSPDTRRERLKALAPPSPARDPQTLSPLASRLRGHVVHLAETIGPRDAWDKKNHDLAREYVAAQFRAAGYAPRLLEYQAQGMPAVKDGTTFANVEARLEVAPAGREAWILGAHFDSAPGTPGADDNASGVAVLLELARLLKEKTPGREVRFVGFDTEEPPSFGSKNMGSWHYARRLKSDGVKVHAMLSLEMLGYFNEKRGSQLYPPFLHLFYPDHGGYVGAVSNVESRARLAEFKRAWDRRPRLELTTSILPGPFSTLALSDQLNFWDLGFPALLLSDTAFYRNPHYHEHTDTADTLDYEKMADVTRSIADVLGAR